MPKDFFINKMKDEFGNRDYISRDELFKFYRYFEPDLKETTFGWRIYDLRKKGILSTVSNGVYMLTVKSKYHPIIEKELREIYIEVIKKYPHARLCVWSTKWLNEWMIHQPGRFLRIIEVEETAAESVFYFLRDNKFNIFINPDTSVINTYLYDPYPTIVLKTLLTKTPIEKQQKIVIPTLEKIMVDLFCEKKLFSPFQGEELNNIFNTIYEKYGLNFSRLFSYARRRSQERELADFIALQTKIKIPGDNLK
jgi:hypothetical protein